MWTDFGPWISVNWNISMQHFDWCKLEGFMKSTVVRTVNDLVNEFVESPNIFWDNSRINHNHEWSRMSSILWPVDTSQKAKTHSKDVLAS